MNEFHNYFARPLYAYTSLSIIEIGTIEQPQTDDNIPIAINALNIAY